MARAEGLFDEALAGFEKVLKVEPNDVDVLASHGYIALERGELEKAEQILRQTIKLDAKIFQRITIWEDCSTAAKIR